MKQNQWLKVGKVLSVAITCSWCANLSAADGELFVAGVQPDRRPANAPVIKEMQKNRAWYDNAVTGISPPFPASFRFLDVQGNWYSPFTHAGMTGRYNIRDWPQNKN